MMSLPSPFLPNLLCGISLSLWSTYISKICFEVFVRVYEMNFFLIMDESESGRATREAPSTLTPTRFAAREDDCYCAIVRILRLCVCYTDMLMGCTSGPPDAKTQKYDRQLR